MLLTTHKIYFYEKNGIVFPQDEIIYRIFIDNKKMEVNLLATGIFCNKFKLQFIAITRYE